MSRALDRGSVSASEPRTWTMTSGPHSSSMLVPNQSFAP